MSEAAIGLRQDELDPGITFRDGLGDRYLAVDGETGDAVERFQVLPDLAAQERALRERVERLLNFRNVRFPRLHALQSETKGQIKSVWLVTEHVPGPRLSELLTFVSSHPTLVIDINAALQVAREVLPALAVLHDSRGVTHGAVAPERLVLTPQARVTIVDYALGAALGQLQFPRTRLWREFRIAMPPSAGVPRFDTRADVANLALAVLALLSGRPLGASDFPNGIRGLLDSAVERLPNGTARPLSSSLKAWFDRALPIESRRPFGTALEAQVALEEVLKKERAYAPAQSALKSFLQRYAVCRPEGAHLCSEPGSSKAKGKHSALAVAPAAPDDAQPAAPRRGRAGSARATPRRLTPQEEEAEEIRALEAELARIAAAEAEAAHAGAGQLAASPAPSAPVSEKPAPAVPGADAAAPPVESGNQAPLQAGMDQPTGPPAVDGLAHATASVPTDLPVEAIEIEIVACGAELPVLDVAALSDQATSIVVAQPDSEIAFDSRDAQSSVEAEIREMERLLEQMQAPASPPIDETPPWVLTPPTCDAPVGAAGDESASEPVTRCEATGSLDFSAPPVYVQDLVAAGAVTKALTARPGVISREDCLRVQWFSACVPPSAREASSPVRRSRRRRAREGVAHVRALPQEASPVAAMLSPRRDGMLAAVARAAAGAGPTAALRLVASGPGKRAGRQPRAALAANAMPVEAGLAILPAKGVLSTLTAGSEVSPAVLRLVPATAWPAAAVLETEPTQPMVGMPTRATGPLREVATSGLPEPGVAAGALAPDVRASDLPSPVTRVESELERLLAALESETASESGPVGEMNLRSTVVAPVLVTTAPADEGEVLEADPVCLPAEEPLPALHAAVARVEAFPGSEIAAAAQSPALGAEAVAAGDVDLRQVPEPAPLVGQDDEVAALEAELARFEAHGEPWRPLTASARAENPGEVVASTPAPAGEDQAPSGVTAIPATPAAVPGTKRSAATARAGRKRSRKTAAKPEATESPLSILPGTPSESPSDTYLATGPAVVVEQIATLAAPALATGDAPVRFMETSSESARISERASLAHEPWRVPREPGSSLSAPSRPPSEPPTDPWNVEAEAAKSALVLPFAGRAVDTEPQPQPAGEPARFDRREAEDPPAVSGRIENPPRSVVEWRSSFDAPDPVATGLPRRIRTGWRIDWKRTAAASLAVMLLEGVAFATAYWIVKPAEMGTLLVQASQAGIEVLIDGRKSGVTPLAVQLKPGRYTLEMRGYGTTKVVPVEISPGVQTTQSVQWPRGSRLGKLSVKTTPTGARILVDGVDRGIAPLLLDDVSVGAHTVVAESPSGTVKNHVQVSEREVAELDVGIFSGWLTVFAPVEVRVFDSGTLLGTSLDGKMLVSAGPHTLELLNKRLGFRETRTVEIEPGRETVLSVEAPNGTIMIEAPDGTEVSVDGQPAGLMPIEKVVAPIGTREVVLKHPALGQRRVTVTVGVDVPARVSLLAPP